MPQQRPLHLDARRVTDLQLSETATLRRSTGARNAYGEWAEEGYTDSTVKTATYPGTTDDGDARVRELMDAGIDIGDIRIFWTLGDVATVSATTAGDVFVYKRDHFRARASERWEDGRFSVTHAVRFDPPDGAGAIAGAAPLERAVRAFIAAGSQIPAEKVVPARDQGPRPSGVHASVLLREDRRDGWPTAHWTPTPDATDPDDGVLDVQVPRTATFDIDFYGTGASDAAHRFSRWAEADNGLEWAVQPVPPTATDRWEPFTVVFPFDLVRLDEIVDDGFEERMRVEMMVRYHDWQQPEVSTVATWEGTLVAEQGGDPATITLTA